MVISQPVISPVSHPEMHHASGEPQSLSSQPPRAPTPGKFASLRAYGSPPQTGTTPDLQHLSSGKCTTILGTPPQGSRWRSTSGELPDIARFGKTPQLRPDAIQRDVLGQQASQRVQIDNPPGAASPEILGRNRLIRPALYEGLSRPIC